jgi:hypothetical protein
MSQLHYVILHHEGIGLPHFDLMFELEPGAALSTWRCEQWPVRDRIRITRLLDHRRDYLEYEGPISGGRGHVRRVASGQYLLRSDIDPIDPDRLNWEMRFQEPATPQGVLIRRWLDSNRQECWDITPS